jgi:hypothetical protein
VTIDSVRVDFPTDDALPARNIIITVNVSNFDIVPKMGETYVPGEGHLHYYLDVEPPTTPGEPAVSEEGTYVAGTETTYVWENVSPGSHTLSVQLVNNDHTSLEPPVTDAIKVTVNVGACGIGIAKPALPRK